MRTVDGKNTLMMATSQGFEGRRGNLPGCVYMNERRRNAAEIFSHTLRTGFRQGRVRFGHLGRRGLCDDVECVDGSFFSRSDLGALYVFQFRYLLASNLYPTLHEIEEAGRVLSRS